MKNLTVGYGIAVQNTVVANTSNAKTMQQALSANYNFGVAQVFALGSKIKTESLVDKTVTRDQTAYEIGVRAPITPVVAVWASAFTGDKKTGADSATLTATTTGRADISGFQLGTTYAFSKRTTAYAIYGEQKVKGKSAATGTKIASTGYAIGLRHTF
jgi:predicted porin